MRMRLQIAHHHKKVMRAIAFEVVSKRDLLKAAALRYRRFVDLDNSQISQTTAKPSNFNHCIADFLETSNIIIQC
jgi:hypothetical protein